MLIIASVVAAQQTAGTLDPTQVYTTGNIVQPTIAGTGQTPWVNGVYQDQLTCWAWGNPGYCGPNAIVRPGNYINFSFGMTDLYQIQSIASVLPNSGMGLRVNGYNFGFMAKNGNGWDDGRQDYLTAYVTFYGTDGKVKDYTNYDLNSKFDWTQFNYTKDFVSPYPAKDLSSVQYGFVGMDNNFWAGPYGPEIYNVSFSLKYSVDPCATNPLYSPTCPGYMDALAKLLPPAPTVDNTTTSTTTTATTTVTTTVVADPISPTVTVTSTPINNTTNTTNTSTTNSTTPTTSTTTATTQTATVQKEGQQQNSSGTSLGLSVISKNQQREQAIATQAVQNATATAQAAATQSQQEANSIASQAVSNSTLSAATTNQSMSNGTGLKTNGSSSTSLTLPGMSPDIMPNQQSQQFTLNNNGNVITNSLSIQNNRQVYNPISVTNQSALSGQSESVSMLQPDFLTNRTNPINEVIEAKQNVPQNSSGQTIGSSVNRNAGDNDVAGGVNIAKMAVAPTGYGDYLNFTLKDAAFYAPKEVYKNQRNVDNARALRQLTNDSKHQQMVEQQYRR